MLIPKFVISYYPDPCNPHSPHLCMCCLWLYNIKPQQHESRSLLFDTILTHAIHIAHFCICFLWFYNNNPQHVQSESPLFVTILTRKIHTAQFMYITSNSKTLKPQQRYYYRKLLVNNWPSSSFHLYSVFLLFNTKTKHCKLQSLWLEKRE